MLTISMADEMRSFKPSLRCRFAVAAACLNSLGSRGFSGFLTLLINAAICASLLSSAPVAAAGNVLRVLAWPGYADADVVKAFETRYNAKVEVTWVDSDEALWAQMHAQDTPPFAKSNRTSIFCIAIKPTTIRFASGFALTIVTCAFS